MHLKLRSAFLLTALLAVSGAVSAQAREEARVLTATQVLEELKAMPDQNMPDWLLARAYGIAVVPDVVKVGLGIGGRRGKGLLVVRGANGQWSSPVFITLTGGSFGWQAGVQSADIILVFTTRAGVDGITDGKLTLGADASVAAGPVGRSASAATDPNFTAEVYSYSRAKGLFAGVAVDGTAITIDGKANALYYTKPGITAGDLLSANAPQPPGSGMRFLGTLRNTTNGTATASAQSNVDSANGDPAAAPTTTTPAAPTQPPKASELKTFPMADPNPGKPPG